jgi:hypothetical protein
MQRRITLLSLDVQSAFYFCSSGLMRTKLPATVKPQTYIKTTAAPQRREIQQ